MADGQFQEVDIPEEPRKGVAGLWQRMKARSARKKKKKDLVAKAKEYSDKLQTERAKLRPLKDTLDEALGNQGAAVGLALVGITGASGVMSGLGIVTDQARFGGESFTTIGQALLAGTALAMVQYCAWAVAIRVSPLLRTFWRRLAGVGLATMLLGATYAVSSTWAFVSLTANSSVTSSMIDRRENRVEIFDAVLMRAEGGQQVLAALQSDSAFLCGLAEQEREGGIITRSPGAGLASASLSGLCMAVNSAISSIETTLAETESGKAAAERTLDKLSDIALDRSRDVYEREQEFERELNRFDQWIRDLRSNDQLLAIRTVVGLMRESVLVMNGADGELGQRQASLLNGLRERLANTTGVIQSSVAEMEQQEVPDLRRQNMPSLFSMALDNWENEKLSLGLVLFNDSLAYFVFLYILLGRRPSNSERKREEMFDEILTLPDVIRDIHSKK